jgi:hypothetical protein
MTLAIADRANKLGLALESFTVHDLRRTGSALVLWRVNPVIFRARNRFQPGTERWTVSCLN